MLSERRYIATEVVVLKEDILEGGDRKHILGDISVEAVGSKAKSVQFAYTVGYN